MDECSGSLDNRCHRYAKCTNTLGSYDCTCNPGYSGDGFTCEGKLKNISSLDVDICLIF